MLLRISIVNKNPEENHITGKLIINESIEYFDSPLDWWSIEEYELQWQEGLRRLLDHDVSCLIVAIDDSRCRKFIEWWPLYKIGNKIHIQNHIMIDDIYEERIGNNPFTHETCYNFIPKYRSHTQEGNKISEWVIDWDNTLE